MTLLSQRSSLFGSLVGALFLAGCATVARPPVEKPVEQRPAPVQGVYHKVQKGETLWRIAKTYKVDIKAIVRANNIPNAASIEEGQLVLIPGVDAKRDVITAQESAQRGSGFTWPVRGRIISYFQDRNGRHVNRGIDIQVPNGAVVRAAREGRVVFADHLAGQGYMLIVDHTDGFYSVYGNNGSLLVKYGDYVFRGEEIAVPAGQGSGRYTHFEIRRGDAPSNPLHYLP